MEPSPPSPLRPLHYDPDDALGLMLGGGGARGAYQAGVLRGIAKRFPNLSFPILTGISAGAVNTIHLAAHEGTLLKAADDLIALWIALSPERVYDVRSAPLLRRTFGWGARLMSGGIGASHEPMRGMVDTGPLRTYLNAVLKCGPDGSLPGIARNIDRGALKAVALSATSYTTGQSVTWIVWHGSPPSQTPTELVASTYGVERAADVPAVRSATSGSDGGADHRGCRRCTGASRILTISTKSRTRVEADVPVTIFTAALGARRVLYNAVFLDPSRTFSGCGAELPSSTCCQRTATRCASWTSSCFAVAGPRQARWRRAAPARPVPLPHARTRHEADGKPGHPQPHPLSGGLPEAADRDRRRGCDRAGRCDRGVPHEARGRPVVSNTDAPLL